MQIGAGRAPRRAPGPPAGLSPRPSRPAAGGRPSAAAPRMPAQEWPQPRTPGPRAQTLRPPAPEPSARSPQCAPGPGELRRRPQKIVFADELRPRAPLHPEKCPGDRGPNPHPVPDYELKYPALSSQTARSRYAAVFHDQYGEFLELQRQVGAALARFRQLEALLTSLPPPQSQNEARVAARVWREFEKKRLDPGFLDKQARCRYLRDKLRHLKAQIRKFDDQGDSDSSVYF